MRVAKMFLSWAGGGPDFEYALLAIQLDDQGLLHRGVDLDPVGPLENLPGQPVVVRLEPRGDGSGQVGGVADGLLGARAGAHGDDVVRLDLVAGDVHAPAVDLEVAVA